jgi:hypothetical protein
LLQNQPNGKFPTRTKEKSFLFNKGILLISSNVTSRIQDDTSELEKNPSLCLRSTEPYKRETKEKS